MGVLSLEPPAPWQNVVHQQERHMGQSLQQQPGASKRLFESASASGGTISVRRNHQR